MCDPTHSLRFAAHEHPAAMYPGHVDAPWSVQDFDMTAPPLLSPLPPPPLSPPLPTQQQQQQHHQQQQHQLPVHAASSPLLLLAPAGACPTWRALPPARWDRGHVFEWVAWHVEGARADASRIPAEALDVDGPALLAMSRRRMEEAAGSEQLGARMHAHLAEMARAYACQEDRDPSERHPATPPEAEPPGAAPAQAEGVKAEAADVHCAQRKHKHGGSRGALLWEFLRDLLLGQAEGGGGAGLLRWEDRQAGSFRFVRAGDVARLWGERKRNPGMTYEKLSRAMRYYYKRGILERVDGRRLVYRFGSKSSGWRPDS
ncbi:ETS-related transcription factor Elf-5-like [Lampetra planeri]